MTYGITVTVKTSVTLKSSIYEYISRAGWFRSYLCQNRDSDAFPQTCNYLFRTKNQVYLIFKPKSSKSVRVTAVIQGFRKDLEVF